MYEQQQTDTTNSESVWKSRRSRHWKVTRRLWVFFGLGILGTVLLFMLLSRDLPSFEELENPKSKLASQVLTADGVMLGRYFTENRVNVNYQDLPPHLEEALIATEDERYYEHSGIDGRALGRVAVKNVLLQQRSAGGGSTLTQQLAKLLVGRPEFTGNPFKKIWRIGTTKLKEWLTAAKLERSYTKEEIMMMYLNQFNFIYGAYGIKSASEIYFGKEPKDLNIEESAMLVGMLKNPALYNPKRFPDKALLRREVVLKQMVRNDLLTEEAYDTIRSKPLDMGNFKRVDHNEGAAPHFREFLRGDLKKLLKQYPKPDGSYYDIYKDGLTIKTTIDSRMQAHAEAAARMQMEKVQQQLFKHWKGMDPWTYKGPPENPERQATDEEIQIRKNALQRLVYQTDRYTSKRPQYLKKATELELRDVDIERLYKAEKDKAIIARWKKSNFIGSKLADKYRSVLRSNDWDVVKDEWKKFQDLIEEEFDTEAKMEVFSYNAEGETDTLMSPMDSLRYHRMHLQVGSIAMDPKTGHIKSWVGGADHKYFKYDHANNDVQRQVGSTIKPFLYTLSIDLRGYSPCYQVMDAPITLEAGTFGGLTQDWTPKNSGDFTNQPITLQTALQKSKNSVSAFLMKDLGSVGPFRDFLGNVGINLERVPPYPSICLGTPNLSVFEMTGAYSAFANEGVFTKPVYITSIEDKNGNIIYESVIEQKQVISEQANYVMLGMLKNVIGGRLGLESEVGGKTGTTNSHADAWFVGVTPNLVMGTWVGGDDRWVRFREITYGQGAYLARPIFGDFMKRVEQDADIDFDTQVRFTIPEQELEIEVDCWKYAQNNLMPGMTAEDMEMLGDSVVGLPEGHPAYQGEGLYPPGGLPGQVLPGQVPATNADEEDEGF